MIHAYASQANYWRHLAPIVDVLRERDITVETWANRGCQPWGDDVRSRRPEGLMLVASWNDAQRWLDRPLVYVEHGAGQTYRDGNPRGYAGADSLSHVRLFLAPGAHVADRWHASYPQAAVDIVGCPALDQHLSAKNQHQHDDDEDQNDGGTADEHRPIVAITAHWRCGVVPETMPALPRFESALRELREAEPSTFQLLGHAHPRAARRAQQMWDRLGVPVEVDPDVVLARADLLVADNTSLLYEAAAIDVPVVVLNSPTYRRDVEHGLRFWSHVPGLQVDEPGQLVGTLDRALADPLEVRMLRRRAACHVYAYRDGRSAERAADAIERVA